MKFYVADFAIRDGDNEYELRFLVKAKNPEDAEEKAIDGLCVNFGVDRSEWDEKEEALDLFSRIIRKGNLPQEVPANEAAVLKNIFGWQQILRKDKENKSGCFLSESRLNRDSTENAK